MSGSARIWRNSQLWSGEDLESMLEEANRDSAGITENGNNQADVQVLNK